jgi:2,3-dihydroxyphenylpropionate 1,2-dioxygenase
MACIPFAAAVPHLSLMVRTPHLIDEDSRGKVYAALESLKADIADARLDALVVLAPDHYNSFFLKNMPSVCVGYGSFSSSPGDSGLPPTRFPVATSIARQIIEGLLGSNMIVSHAHDMSVDHAVVCPLTLLEPERTVPLVPIFVNCAAPPLPPPVAIHAFGTALGRVIAGLPSELRIGLLATGGLSHSVPIPHPDHVKDGLEEEMLARMRDPAEGPFEELFSRAVRERVANISNGGVAGFVNEEFDREVISCLSSGAGGGLAARGTDWIAQHGGNGGQEIRTWLAVAAATGNAPGTALFYKPLRTWMTGICVFNWAVEARSQAAADSVRAPIHA